MIPASRRTSREENTLLTSTRAGTPMGEVLRRFWWPISVSEDLKDKPTFVRVLSEDLVLFRDGKGRLGLMDALCPHRRANLCLGTSGERGLRCRYHGWLFDVDGNVLETPGELPDSEFKTGIKQRAFPVQELGGFIFAYLGPQPAPLLPRWDFLAGEGPRYRRVTGFANCNWLQVVENGMDPVHASFMHGQTWTGVAPSPIYIDYAETDYGVCYRSARTTGDPDKVAFREHHLLVPGISVAPDGFTRNMKGDFASFSGGNSMLPRSARFNTPIDDTHTMVLRVTWKPEGSPAEWKTTPLQAPDWKPDLVQPYNEYKRMENTPPTLGYGWPAAIGAQDATVEDSMGPIADRENENLSGRIDGGVIMFRDILLRAIEDVKAGRDPKGVVRDPHVNALIDIPGFERIVDREEFRQIAATQQAAE